MNSIDASGKGGGAIAVAIGELAVAKAPAKLRTLLGSCVGVLLLDRRLQLAGACQAAHPAGLLRWRPAAGSSTAASRFGARRSAGIARGDGIAWQVCRHGDPRTAAPTERDRRNSGHSAGCQNSRWRQHVPADHQQSTDDRRPECAGCRTRVAASQNRCGRAPLRRNFRPKGAGRCSQRERPSRDLGPGTDSSMKTSEGTQESIR